MSLFGNSEDKQKKKQEKQKQKSEWQEKRKEILSKAPVYVIAEYMGGYEVARKAKGSLSIYLDKVEFKVVLNSNASFTIPNSDISNIAVEGRDEVSRRVTVTRLLATGIFAFALKKKGKDQEAFITLILIDGREVVFNVADKSPMEVKAKLSAAISRIKLPSPSTVSVADELKKLAELKDSKVITQEEFNRKKAELLS